MRKRFSDEPIVRILGEAADHGVPATARQYRVSEPTLSVWRRRFEGMDVRPGVELKRLQQGNARLKTLVAERDFEFNLVLFNRCPNKWAWRSCPRKWMAGD